MSWASCWGAAAWPRCSPGRALGSLGFQKPVAIKRLLPELAKDEEFVGRLVDEAKLLVGCSTPT
jgi:hypothetical protein